MCEVDTLRGQEEFYKVFIVFELRQQQTGDRRGSDVAFVSGYAFTAAHCWRGQTSSRTEKSEAMEKDLCKITTVILLLSRAFFVFVDF